MKEDILTEVIFTEKQIQDKVKELANWVDEKYSESNDLVLISTMLGAIPFSMDLVKHIKKVHEIDFIGVKSYFGSNKQTDLVVVDKEVDVNLSGKDVIILEDIVDSGRTLERIRDLIESKNPKSVWILSLLKREENKVSFENLKYGFVVKKDLFLVGYGLDYKYKYRNIQEIGIFNKRLIEK